LQQPQPASVILVLGGVRSGKSRYAVKLASQAPRVIFLATAKPSDAEMRAKISRHQAERPSQWLTVEEPLALDRVLKQHDSDNQLFLIDCLTLFASNLLEAEAGNEEALKARVACFCADLQSISSSVLLVSNEVGSGVVPAYDSGRRFRDLAGEMNQRVAALADTVLLMVAGLPLVLKGQLEGTP
jgi:adenosylcobinamide kinase/adenosylcobinamide-phosphate guanylyltransferase